MRGGCQKRPMLVASDRVSLPWRGASQSQGKVGPENPFTTIASAFLADALSPIPSSFSPVPPTLPLVFRRVDRLAACRPAPTTNPEGSCEPSPPDSDVARTTHPPQAPTRRACPGNHNQRPLHPAHSLVSSLAHTLSRTTSTPQHRLAAAANNSTQQPCTPTPMLIV